MKAGSGGVTSHVGPTRSPKSRAIQLLHVAKGKLALDDDTYRDILSKASRGRHHSSKDMSVPELEAALAHMKASGFKVRSQKKPAGNPQAGKIRQLWSEIHLAGGVEEASDTAINAFVRRQTGLDDYRWLPPSTASKVIEELKAWKARLSRL